MMYLCTIGWSKPARRMRRSLRWWTGFWLFCRILGRLCGSKIYLSCQYHPWQQHRLASCQWQRTSDSCGAARGSKLRRFRINCEALRSIWLCFRYPSRKQEYKRSQIQLQAEWCNWWSRGWRWSLRRCGLRICLGCYWRISWCSCQIMLLGTRKSAMLPRKVSWHKTT